jgi:capsular polysaccharide biosynthesis protein
MAEAGSELPAIGPFARRGLAEIFAAAPGDALHGLARSTPTGEAQEVALPPMPLGRLLLPGLAGHEPPAGVRWEDASCRSVIPWVCSFGDVRVHGDGGIVLGRGVVVSDTLVHVAPTVQGFAESGEDVFLLGAAEAERLEGAWLSLLCGSHWNHYHWMIDGIGRLAAANAEVLAACQGVLLPAGLSANAVESVRLSGVAQGRAVRVLGPFEAVRVERLVVPWRMSDGFWPHPALPRYLAGLVPEAAANPAFPKRIYIDRRGANNRRLLNEDALVAALEGAGVVPIRLETLSLAAQAALFRQAELVVAPHGAGLVNLVFARPGCAVVELVMDAYQHWGFRRLAALCGLDYDCVPGRAEPGPADGWVHGLAWEIAPAQVQTVVRASLTRLSG